MRLRFTIRDLLWLAVVVALAIGWWLDHRGHANTRYSLLVTDGGATLNIIDKETGNTFKMDSHWVNVVPKP